MPKVYIGIKMSEMDRLSKTMLLGLIFFFKDKSCRTRAQMLVSIVGKANRHIASFRDVSARRSLHIDS